MKYFQKVLFFIIIILFPNFLFSQNKFDVSTIPDELKENAYAVVRYYKLNFEIINTNKIIIEERYAITILNSRGDIFSDLIVFFDKFSRVSDFSGKIYDDKGKQIERLTMSDLYNGSMFSGYNLYDDNKMLYYHPTASSMPYTVEYKYKKVYHGSLFFPHWFPTKYPAYHIAVENATLSIQAESFINLRYKSFMLPEETEFYHNDDKKTNQWNVKNQKAFKQEDYSPPIDELIPSVTLAPTDFQLDNYEGNMETWLNFGKWINLLNKDKDIVPQETVDRLKEMTAGITDTLEITKLVYKYAQEKNRYVSIQVGIGGWQPFSAETVDQKSYGDCKALSNYTKALLKALGIESFYVLVHAGEDAPFLDTDFSTNQFNHAILCVPLNNDTVWLECTNPYAPFGFIGTFTDDRDVLVILEDGGKIQHTKIYTQEENFQHRTADVSILINGCATANVETIYGGIHYSDIMFKLILKEHKQKNWLYENIKIPDYKIENFEMTQDKKDFLPIATIKLKLFVFNYASETNNQIFVPLNIMNQKKHNVIKTSKRKNDIFIRRATSEIDTIIFNIPEFYTINFVPENKNIETVFGQYKTTIKQEENKIIYIRELLINKGRFAPDKYLSFVKFFTKINKFDKEFFIITKNN